MKNIFRFALSAACLCLLSGCVQFTTTDGPHVTLKDIQHTPQAVRQDATFTVEVIGTGGNSAYVDKEAITTKIREAFEASGVFARVTLVDPNQASPNHYHFRYSVIGLEDNARVLLHLVGLCTLGYMPTWCTTDIDATMSYVKDGKEAYSVSESCKGKDFLWLPTAPFCLFFNVWTQKGSVTKDPVFYFVKEIIDKHLY